VHNLNQKRETAGKERAEEQIKTLQILYTNAQSILSKLGELEILASELDPYFILMTESWCNPKVSDASLTIQNCSLETEL
jgi:hypothetical protein